MTTKILLAHGLRGSPFIPIWYQWLKRELKKNGFDVKVPQFPSPGAPKKDEWTATIFSEFDNDLNGAIMVGHSLGGLAILRAIESAKDNVSVRAVILVGTPFSDVGRPEIKEFLSPLDYEKIRSRVESFIYIYSPDDPHVPFSHGREFKKHTGGQLIEMDGMGHFQANETFMEILDVIKKLIE